MRLSFCLVWLLAPPPTLTLGEGGQSKSLSDKGLPQSCCWGSPLGAGTEGGRHGPGETEEDEAGRGGVLCRGQEWGAQSQEAEREAG